MLGKKLYKTSMLNFLRLILLAIVIFFLNDFFLNTFTYEKFQANGRYQLVDVILYHYRYPYEFIVFFFLVIAPAFYYSVIRGVGFFEKGLIYNRGLPFMNKTILYDQIKTYKLLHPKYVLTIHTKKGEVFLIADNTAERVIAILDQHNIAGDLTRDDYANLITNFRKFVMIVLSFTFLVFVLMKLGVFAR